MNRRLALAARSVAAAALATFAACAGAPASVLPPGEGKGLVACDHEPPVGAATYARPEWKVGDTFVLLRGEQVKAEFRVASTANGCYELDFGSEVLLRRDLDLGNLGEWARQDAQPLHVLTPTDVRFAWPLWVGKRWTCEFVDRTLGGAALPMQASYVVEALEPVTVPAGTFDALRIVRHLRLLVDGTWMTRSQIVWYAPTAGVEVRQLIGDTMVELVEHRRGG
ncbi:MAG: hypothetical protein IT455_02285 [Planctomycetes bacterium]|nr:hypothetical protein [Planctomycetota bacterium]